MTPQPSKTKNLFGLGVSILFILLGYYLINKNEGTIYQLSGWACIIFFTIIALFSIVSLVKKSR